MNENDVSTVRMTKGEWGKTRAYATIKFTNGMSVKGIKVIQGAKGLFVGMPSRLTKKEGQDAWEESVFFEDKEDRERLQNFLLNHYKGEGGVPQSSGSFSGDDETSFFED